MYFVRPRASTLEPKELSIKSTAAEPAVWPDLGLKSRKKERCGTRAAPEAAEAEATGLTRRRTDRPG